MEQENTDEESSSSEGTEEERLASDTAIALELESMQEEESSSSDSDGRNQLRAGRPKRTRQKPERYGNPVSYPVQETSLRSRIDLLLSLKREFPDHQSELMNLIFKLIIFSSLL